MTASHPQLTFLPVADVPGAVRARNVGDVAVQIGPILLSPGTGVVLRWPERGRLVVEEENGRRVYDGPDSGVTGSYWRT